VGLENIFRISQNLSALFNEVGLPMVFNDATKFLDAKEDFLGEKDDITGLYLNGTAAGSNGRKTNTSSSRKLFDNLDPPQRRWTEPAPLSSRFRRLVHIRS
jgi:hypothetical protein